MHLLVSSDFWFAILCASQHSHLIWANHSSLIQWRLSSPNQLSLTAHDSAQTTQIDFRHNMHMYFVSLWQTQQDILSFFQFSFTFQYVCFQRKFCMSCFIFVSKTSLFWSKMGGGACDMTLFSICQYFGRYFGNFNKKWSVFGISVSTVTVTYNF